MVLRPTNALALASIAVAPLFWAADSGARDASIAELFETKHTVVELPFAAASLAIHRGGRYVAAGGNGGAVAVAPARSGKTAATFNASASSNSPTFVVLLGSPCVAVAGAMEGHEAPDRDITVADCATGRILRRVKVPGQGLDVLMNLVALPSCSLVVAHYSSGLVSVIDVGRMASRPDLNKRLRRVFKVVAAAEDRDDCMLYGVTGPIVDMPAFRAMGQLIEFDLSSGQRRVLGRVVDHASERDGLTGIVGWLAVSPKRSHVAVTVANPSQVDRSKVGRGTQEFQVFDLAKGGVRRVNGQAIEPLIVEFEYVDDRRIAMRPVGDVYLLDTSTGDVVMLRGTDTSGPAKASPSAGILALSEGRAVHLYKLKSP